MALLEPPVCRVRAMVGQAECYERFEYEELCKYLS